jgi:drug/metabolite transporter (DMT)-like permease
MGIDIRVPIGLMFAVFGAILTVYGSVSNPAIYARSLGIDINSLWGIVLLVFAAIMLALGARSHRRTARGGRTGPASADRGQKSH